jgi:hypothetical protein
MATYLYCVLAPPRPEAFPSGLTGIFGSPVRTLLAGDARRLEAWVATIDDEALRVAGEALVSQALLHNEVVDAAVRTGRTPAPARFGSRFADDAACAADLAGRCAVLGAILDRVAGSVEMSGLIVPARGVRESVGAIQRPQRHEVAAGRRYLESVRQRAARFDHLRRIADAEAERITSTLGGVVRAESRNFGAAGVMSIAHLVLREDVDTYRRMVSGFEPPRGYRFIVAEPRAPYSFTSEKSELGRHDSSNPNSDE